MELGTEVRHLNRNLGNLKGVIVKDPYGKWHRSDTPNGHKMFYVNYTNGVDANGKPLIGEAWFFEHALAESE